MYWVVVVHINKKKKKRKEKCPADTDNPTDCASLALTSSIVSAGQAKIKNYGTQYSRVVPHHSTDCAITSLTSEIRRDPVLPGVYGRS